MLTSSVFNVDKTEVYTQVLARRSVVPLLFRVKLGRTGNSLKLTIPKPIVDGFGWKEGDEIEIHVTDFDISIKRISKKAGDKKAG